MAKTSFYCTQCDYRASTHKSLKAHHAKDHPSLGAVPFGTPKTLLEAIQNGISASSAMTPVPDSIKAHVKDFLAQRFNVAMFEHDEASKWLDALFKKITR